MINKKLVVIVTIIAIIVVCGIIYINLKRESQEQYTFSEQTVENAVENNTEKNTQIEENLEVENQINENKEEDNKVENETNNEIEEDKVSNSTSNAKEESLTSEEKAISLVKKEWGENDNTVYYYVEEQISDNEFIISVRDQNTTEDLSSYKVDVSSESLEKE